MNKTGFPYIDGRLDGNIGQEHGLHIWAARDDFDGEIRIHVRDFTAKYGDAKEVVLGLEKNLTLSSITRYFS